MEPGGHDQRRRRGKDQDGPAEKAEFANPMGVAHGLDGAVYVADSGNGAIRKIHKGVVTTLARYGLKPSEFERFKAPDPR